MTETLTERLGDTPEGIARAASLLREGALVAFPTETVYGLGADARSDRAVARIFEAKGRPQFNPLIVHVTDLDAARAIAELSPEAERLARAFWPGPLTLVLPLRPGSGISELVSAGLPTVAIRMPAHPLARRLLAEAGCPVAAPSANPSGRVSPTRADHVLADLTGRIEAVVDGGACPVGVESTILSLDAPSRLLRAGGLPAEDLGAGLGRPLDTPEAPGAAPNSPGQLASHYAPGAAVRLNVTAPGPEDLWIGFGPTTEAAPLTLSATGDLVEAAARLFALMREADSLTRPGQSLAFAPIPESGLGRAINDRLRRAAAPRP